MRPQDILARIAIVPLFASHVYGQLKTATVDDRDPGIVYLPQSSWDRVGDGPDMDAGGTHMKSTDPTATATIKYTCRFIKRPLTILYS